MSALKDVESVSPREDVVIADAVRSPLSPCRPDSALAGVAAPVLLAQVGLALLNRTLLEPTAVTNVLVAGGAGFDEIAKETCRLMGVAPQPAAPLGACGSQQSIIHTAARMVGRRDVVLVLATAKPDPFQPAHQACRRGIKAELVASQWKLGRAELDAYAQRSQRRAREVAAMGEFGQEIIPAVVWSPESRRVITADETIPDSSPDIGEEPLFYDPDIARRHPEIGWCLHAGNVSRPVIGAAATILLGSDRAEELGVRPRARILALAECPHIPDSPLFGPMRASRAVFERTRIDPDDLDHCEINEAFPSTPLAWYHEFNADSSRLNPRGGSIGLGRPGPAAGLRSLATALSALQATGGRLGIQVSEGRGSAGDALLIESLPRPVCHSEAARATWWKERLVSGETAVGGRTGASAPE